MSDIQVVKRVIDYLGLNVKPVPNDWLKLFKDFPPVLALMQGMTASGAKLVGVDANGALLVTTAGTAAANPFNLTAIAGSIMAAGNTFADNQAGAAVALEVAAKGFMSDGTTWWYLKSGSVFNLSQLLANQALQTIPPNSTQVISAPAVGVQASASRASQGAVASNVLAGFDIIVSCQVAPAAGTLTINLRDGLTGAGTIKKQWVIQIPAAIFQPIVISKSGLTIMGSANTAMTLEQSAAYAAVGVSISWDAMSSN